MFGGDDTLYGSDDVDYLVGGTGNDKIFGEDGPDLAFGDHATIILDKHQSHKLVTATTTNAGCVAVGADIIYLGPGDVSAWLRHCRC